MLICTSLYNTHAGAVNRIGDWCAFAKLSRHLLLSCDLQYMYKLLSENSCESLEMHEVMCYNSDTKCKGGLHYGNQSAEPANQQNN